MSDLLNVDVPGVVKVVVATGTATASNVGGDTSLANKIELAQRQSIQRCYDAGTTDVATLRTHMEAARQAALAS